MDFSSFCKLAVFICLFHLSNGGGKDIEEMTEKFVEATFTPAQKQEYQELKEAGLLEEGYKNETKNHTQALYDGNLARAMLEYSAIAYVSDVKRLKEWSCLRCKGIVADFQMIDVVADVPQELQGFVGYDKKLNAIVVAFRGTKPFKLKNFLVDAAGFQLDLTYPGMHGVKIHSGFFFAWHNTSLETGVAAALDRAKAAHSGTRFIITGHSLGGAIAAVCALDLTVNKGYKNLEVITFGQPRVGNQAFSDFYQQNLPNTIRVINKHDIVAQVPPYMPVFPHLTYHHPGTEVWFHNNGTGPVAEKVCDGTGEDPTCIRSSPLASLMDHIWYYNTLVGCIDPCPIT